MTNGKLIAPCVRSTRRADQKGALACARLLVHEGRAARRCCVSALTLVALCGCGEPGPAGQAQSSAAKSPTTALAQADAAWPSAPPLPTAPDLEAGELPPSVKAVRGQRGGWQVTFSHRPDHPARTIFLAGSFNSWNPQGTAMEDSDGDGEWSAQVTLGDGEYHYKFVVDGSWRHDPQNTDKVEDGHQGFNSVLYIGQLGALDASPGRSGDGKIDVGGLQHRPEQQKYLQPLGPSAALFRFRTFSHDVERVFLTVRGWRDVELHPEAEGPVLTYWEGVVESLPSNGTLEYTFVLEDGALRVSDPTRYTLSLSERTTFDTPEWARHAIWYQIFPDRFRNGDAGNDPERVIPWTMDWFNAAPWEARDGATFYKYDVFFRFYGGDFQGVEQKLDYLRELGVNALYFNPIFKAESNHKYDATNFLHVDDHFGVKGDYAAVAAVENLLDPATWKWTDSDKLFLEFLKKAKAMGFRVILDGVFNHVGVQHPAFQDVMKNGKASPYADWFAIKSWAPFDYEGWAGHKSLPVFAKGATGLASPSARKHIFDVTRRWMDPDGDGDPRDGIDGWRLDVPNEIPAPFWVEWRAHVKSINPHAFISGEIWDRADLWLDGKHFDAVMNYQFAQSVIGWVCHRDKRLKVSEMDRKLAELRLAYPAPATYVLQNLVDSHDTDRLTSMALNPDRKFDAENRIQDNGPKYNNARPGPLEYAKARLVALIQMTYVGAPMIYYGDEAGMWGADDPTCRKPMLWQDLQPYENPGENFVAPEHLEHYRQVIALRNAHPALRIGAFQTLLADDEANVWAYERFQSKERLIVAINAADAARVVSLPLKVGAAANWKMVFGGTEAVAAAGGKLPLKLAPLSGVVLLAE